MQNPFVIPDGFTLDGHIDPIPGALRGVRFRYRLIRPAAAQAVQSAFGDARVTARAEAVAKHTTDWRVVNDDDTDEPIAVTADMLLNAPSLILETAWAFVTGTIGPDVRATLGKSSPGSG
jgi:hypothetical protein